MTTARTGIVRLNRLLARMGLCSRREADSFIGRGLVEVDGRVVSELGAKMTQSSLSSEPESRIRLLPDAHRELSMQRTVILHKPLGIVSGQPEGPDQVPAIRLCASEREFVPPRHRRRRDDDGRRRSRRQHSPSDAGDVEPRGQRGYAAAGRLDVNSTGLLVLTQSGRIASRLVGGDSWVEKEYLVRIEGGGGLPRRRPAPSPPPPPRRRRPASTCSQLDEDDVAVEDDVRDKLELLRAGILDGGDLLRAESVEVLRDDNSHDDGDDDLRLQLRFVLTEGRHRHIRRMCDAVGWKVTALKRVRIGNVVLGNLPLGCWRYLRPNEKF